MSFKVREEANKTPDTMGDTYEFVKLNIDDFIAFVDNLDSIVHRNVGPVAMFLNSTRPDHNWHVTPGRIYFTSNAPYPEGDHETITEDRTVTVEEGWPAAPGMKYEFIYPAGTTFYDSAKVHPNKFSETQKWVAKIEDWVMNIDKETLTGSEIREMIKKATGK